MSQELRNQLSTELKAFAGLEPTGPTTSIIDAYNRVLAIVQAMMLDSDNPDAHARAWSLLNDDAYKDLSDIEEGKAAAFAELQFKISQVGELLLEPKS